MELVESIAVQAIRELTEERHRAEVDKYKDYLRKKRTFWDKVFPWIIKIERKRTFYDRYQKGN